ncbi:MAG: GDP-mannose 4,6-dehydratase [candidate division WOR-3 bacterium]|jgi:GDP-4-dehydro-6-deoxy-D-mannose reductase
MPVRRALITGIEGFVGTHLCRYLQQSGIEVAGIHLNEPVEQLNARLCHADICNFSQVKSALEQTRPEWIFHLAGISSVAEAEKNPIPTYLVNTIGTLKLLLAVHQLMLPCRILLVSSADVYGRADRPHLETDPPAPLTAYARSKLLAEEIGRLYYQTWEMDIIIVRPFSHTGPGQAPHFVFPKVARHIALVEKGKAEPVLKMGDLTVRRDYLDVRDVVRAYVLAMENALSGETYNITSGNCIRLRDGVDLLLKKARVPIELRSGATEIRPYDIPYLSGSAEKFRLITGWQPGFPLEKTLDDLLEYYRQRV